MRNYKIGDIKLLLTKSGGRCYFQDCLEPMIKDVETGCVGQIAHIVSGEPNGPRHDPAYPKEKLDTFENLIVLCGPHHGQVDPKTTEGKKNTEWTTDKLRLLKKEHEEMVGRMWQRAVPWKCNFSQVEYINIKRFTSLAALEGIDFDASEFDGKTCLHNHGFDLGQLMYRAEKVMNSINTKLIDLEEDQQLTQDMVGINISFSGSFRTKNGLVVLKVISGGKLTGNPDKDPYIYKKYSKFKLILRIDPFWITSSTAMSEFCHGTTNFAGVGFIKRVDLKNKVVEASPYVIGFPKAQYSFPE